MEHRSCCSRLQRHTILPPISATCFTSIRSACTASSCRLALRTFSIQRQTRVVAPLLCFWRLTRSGWCAADPAHRARASRWSSMSATVRTWPRASWAWRSRGYLARPWAVEARSDRKWLRRQFRCRRRSASFTHAVGRHSSPGSLSRLATKLLFKPIRSTNRFPSSAMGTTSR